MVQPHINVWRLVVMALADQGSLLTIIKVVICGKYKNLNKITKN